MERLEEEKLYFLLLKSVKHKVAQFREKCLNSFVADCRWNVRDCFRILKDTSLQGELSAGFIVVDALLVVPGVSKKSNRQTNL